MGWPWLSTGLSFTEPRSWLSKRVEGLSLPDPPWVRSARGRGRSSKPPCTRIGLSHGKAAPGRLSAPFCPGLSPAPALQWDVLSVQCHCLLLRCPGCPILRGEQINTNGHQIPLRAGTNEGTGEGTEIASSGTKNPRGQLLFPVQGLSPRGPGRGRVGVTPS